ncbi:AAA domain-containing protein [Geminocystis sp.]|uniref:AAA domain-containing protein n=1 Tax=Geminocystis sp. TaxID=2664100 RepID=UPI0035940598
MWKDLQDNTDILLKNHLVEQVASGGLKPLEDPVGELTPDVLDKVPISEIPAVVSGDSSQLLAVYAALQGRSFVLQGPPGAGKSQTITNLIAAFLAKGKSVLFIAEKMAALEVVQRRLNSISVGDFCLELHSSDVNRKQVVDSLIASFNQQRLSKVDASDLLADLEQIRQKLGSYPIALHQKQSLGLSMYEIMGELEGLESIPTVSLPSSVVEEITPSQLKEMNQALENYAHRVTLVEPITEHLWRFSNCADWSLSLELEITNLLNQLRNNASDLEDKLSLWLDNICNQNGNSVLNNQWKPSWNFIKQIPSLGQFINNNIPESIYDQNNWTKYSEIAKEWLNASRDSFERKQQVSQRWQDSIYGLDLVAKIKTFEKLERMFPLFRWIMQIIPRFSLRSIVKGKLPSNQQILTDLRSSIEVKNLSSRIEPLNKEIERLFSPYWQSDYNSFDELKLLIEKRDILHELICQLEPQLLELISNLKNQTNSIKDELIALIDELNDSITIFDNNWQKFNQLVEVKTDIISRQDEDFITHIKILLNQLNTAQRDFQNWCRYQKTIKELEDKQLESFVKAHQKGEIEVDKLAKVLRKSILYPWFVKYFDSQSILRDFDGNEQREYIHKFNTLYKQYLKLNQQVIKSELCQNLPSGAVVFEGSEVGVLKRENEKQKAHIPIRALLQKIPNLLPKLKPCLLMSPASVAHFLPADGNPFDLVVFDEASQVETHNAIGALARGKQVVIVGDSKQMPPTSFFGGAGGGDTIIDENDIVEMESFLTEAIASQFPEQMLEWHYRSRHEMLIQFSNHNYYKGKLNIFPAAETKSNELGVKWHHIKDGYYLKGEEKNNPVEARALVDYLVQRLKNYEAKKRTFGLITFSMPQKFLIDELLDEARRLYPEIEPHFDKEFDERVFVKNLENVQGDERDEILFSICYAPDKNGNFSVNFGPLNRQGGERRLNVAVTRARECMHIFSTITGSQIDMNRTDAIGALHLKEFLEFAEKSSQESVRSFLRTNDFDSDIERQIYEELVKMGYTVNCKVGSGSYRVDLAVVHPNNSSIYVLGIETDGISYNQAPTVLDREGVRQVVLGLMRWNMYRIWSVDWKFKREEEVAKLKQAVEKAIKEFDNKTTFSSENNNETAKDNESSPIKDEIPNELKVSELKPNELEENQSNVLIVQENSPSGFKLRANEQIEDNISQAINDLVNNISSQNNQVSQNSEKLNTDEKKEKSNKYLCKN